MITRRVFVASGVVVAAGAGGWMVARDGDTQAVESPAGIAGQLVLDSGGGPDFEQLLRSLVGTDSLGRQWLQSAGEAGAGQLLADLSPLLQLESPRLEAAVAERVRADFAAGELCLVEGWQLSMTECRLIALRHHLAQAEPANARLLARETEQGSPDDYTSGEIAPLAKWGPQNTQVGERFNVQLDGHSGLWFQFSGAPAHARIALDGQLLKTSVSARVVTSGIAGELQDRILSTPGTYRLSLVDPARRIRQDIGDFEVLAPGSQIAGRAAPGGFCEIEKWGPRSTRVGLVRNEQADGGMGVWVVSDCMPADARLQVGSDLVRSGVRRNGLTGSVPAALLENPGELELYLVSERLGRRQRVGALTILE